MEANAFLGFHGVFTAKQGERPVLRVAGSSLYRAWVNGKFAGCGPVRAGHGYARVDEWPLEKLVQNGTNIVAIEVRAYNDYSGGIINLAVQPGFLQAEVLRDGRALCATGRDFTFFDLPNVKNVSRWSAQRAYIEAYRLKPDWDAWRTALDLKGGTPVPVKGPKLLPRILSYPDLKVVPGHAAFTTTFDWDASSPKKNPKLAFDSRDAIGRVKAVKSIPVPAAMEPAYHPVGKGRGVIAAFGKNNAVNAGFPGFTVRCREPGVMWCVIDEGLIGGVVDPVKRFRHPMAFVLDLQAPGEYRIEAFEATSLAYAHVFMESGAAEVGGFFLREYKNPLAYRATFECSDAALNRIFAAAQETCAQNTMDSEMDCPSRERNCCSMDANMALQGYNLLAGNRDVERLFFENRHFSTNFPGTRAGWLPSHYPANVTFAVYGNIPNLVMWFILHLERHTRETGDRTLAEMLRGQVLTAVAELEKYRNADGLLENLPGWTFLGWGNEGQGPNFKGVNYPTNMLWAEALVALARLYGQPERLAEAERVRSAVRRLSWNGTWFRDGDHGSKTSEGCQCYAFFCNLASPTTDPELWRRFVEELGPGRAKGARPEVFPAETWMGGMMRIDCLLRAGMDRQARAEMKRYFQHMADLSGTLWEGLDHLAANAMSHGFNAAVADYLAQSALGVRRIDHHAKRVELRAPSDGELAHARGSFPTADGPIVYEWTRENGALKEMVRLPPGWTREQAAPSFVAAVPVWPEGRTEEANAFVGFRADFAVRKGERPVLRVTGSSLYRAWVNGKFAGYGPARAGHGYFRVDEWPLEKLVQEGTNAVAIEVRAYNLFHQGINSIAVQPGFVEAEIAVGGDVRCATGRDFTCVDIPNAKKVSRWSPHRGQIEAYRLRKDWDAWRTAPGFCGMKPARVPSVRLLERIVSYPDFQIRPGRTVSATTFSYDAARAPAHAELEFDAKDVSDRIRDTKTTPLPAGTRFAPVSTGRGVIADFGGNHAGFCGLTVRCREPGTLWVFVDEMLMNGIVDPARRTRYATALVYELKEPGEYHLEAFEATSLGVVHAFMTSGAAEVGEFHIREYENPDVRAATFRCSDPALERIFAAAQETCAQNTMDAQMDCPSRERMSCPCDAHYTLAGCNLLAGHHAVERLFFDCYRLSTNYCSHVPGRLPGMYPNSAGPGGTASIPNWNMYMVLQLERYVRETGDRRFAEALKEKLLETMETLKRSRNAEGLLENVPGWVFVSWDRANGLTKGVNYPTNMLWAEALDAAARLYGVREYAEEAVRVRTAVRARSWNGAWFRDSSLDDATTESCQAYAFRFGAATPATHPALWRTFRDELGPCRTRGAHSAVAPSETFIGGTLRLECLMAADEHRAVLRDVKGYFQRMAKTTGTLWEGLDPYAHNTLSHGFNSFAAVCLAKSALGIMSLDRTGKTVELCAPDNGLAFCRGSFPTADGPIVYEWTRENGKLREEVRLPPGWSRRTAPSGKPSLAARRATTPVHKLNVGWWKEHFERNRDWAKSRPFVFVFIGDSIMHRWEYEPAGLRVWPRKLAKYRILNCGCAGDRTEHVLWRIDHGEIDGIDPKIVFVHIGTNNAGQLKPEQESPEDTAAGIAAILARVQAKLPRAKIVLHPIFLRGRDATDPVRLRNERVNALIRPLADGVRVVWMDLRPLFSNPDGTISPDMMKDFLHLTSDAGYERWADAIAPLLDQALQESRSPRPRLCESIGDAEIGRSLPAWREGELDLHFVYTGTGENQFWIFPDGTTMVCDTGDYNAPGYRDEIPLLPSGARTGGEWMARYIRAVSPARDRIDYMMVSHWHSDHGGELKYAYTTPDGRKTSGLATVGEFFRIGTFFDHQYPEPDKYGKGEAHVARMLRDFAARAHAKDGTRQEPFRVGALNQISLRHDSAGRYATRFSVRNICANGVVWTGKDGETRDVLGDHVKNRGNKGFDENLLSAALVIQYGRFRYYTGGDVCGTLSDPSGKSFSYEARVGSVVGRVDVCKCNHHAWKGSMHPEFVENVKASAYVINVWSPEQIQDEQMSRMISRSCHPGERFIFPTFIPERARKAWPDKSWWRETSSKTGHVVVRVAPGGETYRIYILDAHDEAHRICSVYEGVSDAALN